jgi:hypothetical protein
MRLAVFVSLASATLALASTGSSTARTDLCTEAMQASTPDSRNVIRLGCIEVKGNLDDPKVVAIESGMPTAETPVLLERDFVQAIQGNLDRETLEYRNAERD